MNTTQSAKNRNGIDAAKFLCSILVVAIHFSPFGKAGGIYEYLNYGITNYVARIAVPFFFISSGYFLFRKTSLGSFDTGVVKQYVLRILKLYLVWSAIYLPINVYHAINLKRGFLRSALTYLREFLFIGSYTHLWYLNALIVAVIAVSFLLYKKVSPNCVFLLAFLLYFIGLFGNSWFGLAIPLRTAAPRLWGVLHRLKDVFATTRNGIFDGFIFVSIGMLFAFYGNRIKKRAAAAGFLASMILLGFEIFLLRYCQIEMLGTDMFLFLVPAAYFFFAYVEQIEWKDKGVYKTLRVTGSLIFYTHLWVAFAVIKVVSKIDETLLSTGFSFVSILILSMMISWLVYKLSLKRRFAFLRILYR